MLAVSATNCEIKHAFPTQIRRSSKPPTAASFINQSDAAYAHPYMEIDGTNIL